ncbi:CCA tRNA nucleotidyltransferase [Tropicibacter sp. R15_0]|uniref:CCA tRNA nucleotidyltransferase n=1 Tax=Tropicibacter sp. R15_0 TaxID=2821101 RepID=UPI001ADD103A|nr:CCA tRNA nucleotidyltransferase [Tropicibacter sp. R15_0]MBO9463807.1 CCA tRNA nucleotidyltransferase [Tropicibacter sp. R15_0]
MERITGDWLLADGAQRVMSMLEEAGFQALAVGGCVRNALLGAPVADVDISTDARPQKVMELAKKVGLKAIPTGIDHGTITVVSGGEPYEITTFRADIETDGRRAVIRFADEVAEDAIRRDFTMNALYADRTGRVIDPLGGLPDLKARRLRFIEDADRRIREDYLRILRFFRFAAWYGDPSEGMDAEALSAIASNLDGLEQLSRERVGSEIVKLLSAPDPTMAVSVMEQTGVLARVLPGAVAKPLGPLVMNEGTLKLAPDGLRRLVTLGFVDGASLRLSKVQQRQIELYQRLISAQEPSRELAYRHGARAACEALAMQAASLEQPVTLPDYRALEAAETAKFPITAKDLMPDFSGAALGVRLKELEAAWIASDFILSKAELLSSHNKG